MKSAAIEKNDEEILKHDIESIIMSAIYFYKPRTPLGAKLLAVRNKAIAEGLFLLDSDEICKEVNCRRGEML